MTHRKNILILSLATVLLVVMVLPVDAAGTTTLSALATKVQQLITKTSKLAKDGTMKATYVKYDNKKTGLTASTAQAAIDELGMTVKRLIAGAKVTTTKASSTGVRAMSTSTTSLKPTTWKGYGYSYGLNPLVNGMISKTAEITVTFTPTSETTGTFTSSPLYIFSPSGYDFFSIKYGNTTQEVGGISRCGVPASAPNGGMYPTGTFGGQYELMDNFVIWTAPTSSTHENCVVPQNNGYFYSKPSEIRSQGTTLYITNSMGDQIILEQQ